MATTFTTAEQINGYQMITIRKALELYAKHHIQVNRAYTPTNMLATAGRLTGKTFKRGQYEQAIAALTEAIGF